MVAAGMIKKLFKGLKKRKQHLKAHPPHTHTENPCIKKQTEDTSGQKAQQTNPKKKCNKTLSFYRISRKNLSGK